MIAQQQDLQSYVDFLSNQRARGASIRSLAEGLCRQFDLEPDYACDIALDWLRQNDE